MVSRREERTAIQRLAHALRSIEVHARIGYGAPAEEQSPYLDDIRQRAGAALDAAKPFLQQPHGGKRAKAGRPRKPASELKPQSLRVRKMRDKREWKAKRQAAGLKNRTGTAIV